jgi:ATP-dependent Clp protease adapter protein ClpS
VPVRTIRGMTVKKATRVVSEAHTKGQAVAKTVTRSLPSPTRIACARRG